MKNVKSLKNDVFSKAFWKSQRGQVTFCIAGLLLSALFLLSQFGFSCSALLPSDGDRTAMENELKKLMQEELELQGKLSAQADLRSAAGAKLGNAWQAAVHGEPEVELRAMLENVAKNMELRLTNISTVRRSSFSKDISLLEVDVTLTAELETLMKFLLAIDDLKPELYWKRFDCRSSNQFGMPVVVFSGTLRCANDEKSIPAPAASEDSEKEQSNNNVTPNEGTPAAGEAPATAVEALSNTVETPAGATAENGGSK